MAKKLMDGRKRGSGVRKRGHRNYYCRESKIVLFLLSEGFNSAQILYICNKRLRLKDPNIYEKVRYLVKNQEIQDATDYFQANPLPDKDKPWSDLVFEIKALGFNSTQIRYVCTKLLGITKKQIYNKINRNVKRVEIEDAERKIDSQKILNKLRLRGLT